MNVPPEIRRKNRWLLIGLIVFAAGLCAACLWWMRVTVRANGGIVDPQQPHAVLRHAAAPHRLAA